MPAKLKGLFDRILLPGRAFQPVEGKPFPEQLLAGKSAEVFITSDTPDWFFNLVYGAGLKKQIRRQIFGYVGIKPVRIFNFAAMKQADKPKRDKWLGQVERQAQKLS